MTTPDLATLIGTTPSWITRALANDPRARKIRTRLALALTAEQAATLNLTREHQIATHLKAMRQNFEAMITATQKRIIELPTTFGLVRLIDHRFIPTA